MRRLDYRLLIVDDDIEVRYALHAALDRDGASVTEVGSGSEALARLEQESFDIVLLDQRLPDAEGTALLEEIRRSQPDALVIMMTAYGTRRTAIQAVERGAYDFFTKPVKLDELRIVMSRALERRSLSREVSRLRSRVVDVDSYGDMLGRSPAMQTVFETLAKVERSDATVLILGESGTGKELVAQAIHERSQRHANPLVKLNCVAIPPTLLESELFGHEKGSFTGAHQRKVGKFELADGGSILLDEIGDMSLDTQAKILRVLQEREFERVGGVQSVRVDVRVIAATNRDLAAAVEDGTFREDLYFRLNVVTVMLPPLRDRGDDVAMLAERFMLESAAEHDKSVTEISAEAIDAIRAYPWPGNVRQLRHAVERATIWAEGAELRREDLPAEIISGSLVRMRTAGQQHASLPQTLERVEREILVDALRQAGGVQAVAARKLGISERSMWHKVKKHAIDVARIKS